MGDGPRIPVSLSGPRPIKHATGIPWMLPEGEVSGVFMSVWASYAPAQYGSTLAPTPALAFSGRRIKWSSWWKVE